MKKLLLSFALAAFAFAPTFASHLMGGQITARQLSGTTYEFTLVLYRDTTGIPLSNPQLIITNVGGVLPAWTVSKTLTTTPTTFLNGVEEYIFTDTTTLLGLGYYHINYEMCCRNGAILNAQANSMYLSTNLSVMGGGGVVSANSTPVFLNAPVTVAQLNTAFTYNPMPFDADGDSLAWSLTTPLQGPNLPLSGYSPPAGSAPFVMDSLTGQISWTPNTVGNFVTSVLVEEYRNGFKIGEIRRDMQLLVLMPVTPRPAFNTTNFPTNAQGNFVFDAPAGYPLNVTVGVSDVNVTNLLTLSATGEPLLQAINAATFPTQSGAESVQSTFEWQPTVAQIRAQPYVLNFRVQQNYQNRAFIYDLSTLIQVRAVVLGSQDIDLKNSLNIYPNPANGAFAIAFLLGKNTNTRITLQDPTGKTVQTIADKELPYGKNIVMVDGANLAKGIYFVHIQTDRQSSVRKLMVQ